MDTAELYTKNRKYPRNIAIGAEYEVYCMTIMHVFIVSLECHRVELPLLITQYHQPGGTCRNRGGAVGRLRSGGREWPVYALSADLSRRSECMASNKYCVAFEIDGQPAFSIACDEVSSLTLDSAAQIKPLQSFMRNHGNPIEALVLKDDRLMFVSRAESMQKFLNTEIAA
jgi:hypothetical protein